MGAGTNNLPTSRTYRKGLTENFELSRKDYISHLSLYCEKEIERYGKLGETKERTE